MPHRIMFSDIDGTLLNSQRELSDYTISEIKRIKDSIPIILISSRMPSAMIHLQKELGITDQPMICYNGGLIIRHEKVVHSTFITPDIIEAIHDFSATIPVHISLYHNDDWYVPTMDFWANREAQNTKVNPTIKPITDTIKLWKSKNKGAHKIMCMGDEEHIDSLFIFLEKTYGDRLHLYRSKPTYIEIAHEKISKLTAIEFLLENYFNISIKDAVAFGDNYNDIAMLKAVGTGIAVANAKPETLEIADIVTPAGKEDGVATYIKNHMQYL